MRCRQGLWLASRQSAREPLSKSLFLLIAFEKPCGEREVKACWCVILANSGQLEKLPFPHLNSPARLQNTFQYLPFLTIGHTIEESSLDFSRCSSEVPKLLDRAFCALKGPTCALDNRHFLRAAVPLTAGPDHLVIPGRQAAVATFMPLPCCRRCIRDAATSDPCGRWPPAAPLAVGTLAAAGEQSDGQTTTRDHSGFDTDLPSVRLLARWIV